MIGGLMRHGGARPLATVAYIFLIYGGIALVATIVHVYHASGPINLGVLNLLIGIGLRRRDPTWYRWAIVVCWLGLVVTGVLLLFLAFGLSPHLEVTVWELPIDSVPRAAIGAYAVGNILLTIWELYVLRHPDTSALFSQTGNAATSVAAAL
ncbi:MAG: hypothetical protein ABJE47_25515 [bacterium]